MPPPALSKNIKLNERGQKRLREALLGEQGFGFPTRIRGYRLVGEVLGPLEPLFDRNDHNKTPYNDGFPDPDDFAWEAMSLEFWDRFTEKLDSKDPNKSWYRRNTWHPTKRLDIEVWCSVVEDEEPEYLYIPVLRKDSPFRMLLSSFNLRMRVSNSKAEIKARCQLEQLLNGRQRRELLLNNGFVEVGQSGVHYLIRANRPTVAFRQEELPDRMKDIHFLAALCLHPLGYYEDTFTGCMPPSDEMLAHVQMIRADEHFFWRKCGQHELRDSRSGI